MTNEKWKIYLPAPGAYLVLSAYQLLVLSAYQLKAHPLTQVVLTSAPAACFLRLLRPEPARRYTSMSRFLFQFPKPGA
jgi:hypothetical protein